MKKASLYKSLENSINTTKAFKANKKSIKKYDSLFISIFIFFIQQMETQKTQWSAEQNVGQATRLKQLGNKQFSGKKYKQALRFYHKAILHLAGIVDKSSSVAAYTNKVANEATSTQANELKFSIYLNMSQIYIYQLKFEKGLQVLSKAQLIKSNAKLHYRRGICNMKLSQFDRAKYQFKKVIDLDPSMKAQVDKIMLQLRQLQKKQDQKSKNLFQKFFK